MGRRSPLQETKVINTIKEWSRFGNIRFVPVAANGIIRVGFNPSLGSYSRVGRDDNLRTPVQYATMNLGWITDFDNKVSPPERGTILHEFGHVLGLEHEHQSPVVDQGITLDPKAIEEYFMRTQGWSKEDVQEQILTKLTLREVSNYSTWDRDSIMQYFMSAELNKQRIEIPPHSELSTTDKDYMRLNYPFSLKEKPEFEAELRQSMTRLGMDRGNQDDIIQCLQEDKFDDARIHFTLWNDKARANGRGPNDGSARDVRGPASDANPTKVDTRVPGTGDFLPAIIAELKQFFNPGGGQIFVLQFPGRFLQQSLYAWDAKTAGMYGQFVKPTAVNESEFRLVDQMYDLAEVVSGPNGINLSIVYEQLLHNLLPIYQDGSLARQQAKIRQWLLRDAKISSWMMKIIQEQANQRAAGTVRAIEEPPASGPGSAVAFDVSDKSSDRVNRLELSNALMQEYLEAKQQWELERDAMIEESLQYKLGTPDSEVKLNNLTRKLAHITAVREAQLASKYSDAVVQGFYHSVRQYLGYLDVKSAAEFLQDAKDALREAALSSLDGDLKVYPVQMSPVDWFEGLSTSFSVEDLTSSAEMISQSIQDKSAQIDSLNMELSRLTLGTKGVPDKLRKDVETYQDEFDAATATLVSTYSQSVISMAKTCIDAYGKVQRGRLESVMSKVDPKLKDPKTEAAIKILDDLETGLKNVSESQEKLTRASRAFSDALAKYALAEATDTRQQQEQIKIQIASITRDLTELNARYTALNTTDSGPLPVPDQASLKVADFNVLPSTNKTSGGSRWQEITLYHTVKSDYSFDSSKAESSVSSRRCNLFFGSYSRSSSTASANSQHEGGDAGLNIDIGFRATMVTVDRSGWFQPQFFKQSNGFFHVNKQLKWTEYPSDADTPEEAKLKIENFKKMNKGLLPAYPVGYIICKDITVKILSRGSATADQTAYMEEKSSRSGGFLCFGGGNSRSSSSSSQGHSFVACSDGYIVRIPGPQILGYILQLTQKDETQPLPDTLPDNFFVPDEDVDAATGAGSGLAHAVQAETVIDKLDGVLKSMGVSEDTLRSVHEEMKRELSSIVGGSRG